MKTQILAYLAIPMLCASYAQAGINGTYKVCGIEINEGEKLTFSGTVKVSQSKVGKYSLNFSDGDKGTFSFKFNKPLKELKTPQTVTYSSSIGSGTATFSYAGGRHQVVFNYKAKGEDIRGSGKGVK